MMNLRMVPVSVSKVLRIVRLNYKRNDSFLKVRTYLDILEEVASFFLIQSSII
jgi:hypothetical protein